MKKIIRNLSLTLVMLTIALSFAACGPKKAPPAPPPVAFIVSLDSNKVPGITVSVDQTTTKKTFVSGIDSNGRVTAYGALGELDMITVNVNGTVSYADCNEFATDMNGYFTDFFTLGINAPIDTKYVDIKDGLPARIEDVTIINNRYITKVQWLLNGSPWTICGNTTSNDGFYYIGFLNSESKVLQEYFVRVVYNITFIS